MKSVYCEIRTGSLNKAVWTSSLKGKFETCSVFWEHKVVLVWQYDISTHVITDHHGSDTLKKPHVDLDIALALCHSSGSLSPGSHA